MWSYSHCFLSLNEDLIQYSELVLWAYLAFSLFSAGIILDPHFSFLRCLILT